ncbi:MAG: hypothetical protein N838_28455 [Thiohalocapsa sp. PB-PSB1]|mgnify:CR=1 FL=1|jgi:predicted nucleic acid-binding protein|nr:MAG: hypothetical protein N838_31675 [Thiohalocapsa sp. PB-PSB1]QQO56710.1 MAG: hypothetical protein N838_28455 [Thiohalocapsa sp. PB-PSB1]
MRDYVALPMNLVDVSAVLLAEPLDAGHILSTDSADAAAEVAREQNSGNADTNLSISIQSTTRYG